MLGALIKTKVKFMLAKEDFYMYRYCYCSKIIEATVSPISVDLH